MNRKVSVSVKQKLVFDDPVEVAECPDVEFSDLNCVRIGDDYFLPSIEWTKYVPAEKYGAGDDAGGFEPVDGTDWEKIHHAIMDEKIRVRKA